MLRFLVTLVILIGVTTSAKAQVWESTSGPRGNDVVTELHVGLDNSLYAVAWSLSKSTNGGADWKMVLRDGLPIPAKAMTIDSSGGITVISAVGTPAHIIFSSDNGETWKLVGTTAFTVKPMISQGSGVLIASHSSTLRSNDSGKTWKPSTEGRLLGIDARGTLFASGQSDNGLVVSSDTGSSWSPVACPDGRIINFFSTGDELYITIDYSKVYRAKIGEYVWTLLPWASQLYGFAVSAARGNSIFAHSRAGVVYRSDDKGMTWSTSTEGIPITAWINDIITDRSNRLYFTMDRAVFRERIGAGLDETRSKKLQVLRRQNTIYLSVSEEDLGKEFHIDVFDVLGRRVASCSTSGSGVIATLANRQSAFVHVMSGKNTLLQTFLP